MELEFLNKNVSCGTLLLEFLLEVKHMKSIREDIIEQKKLVEQEKNALDKKFSVIAGLRLASFLVAIVLIFIGITEKNYLLMFPGLVLLIGFIDLVRRHAVIEEKVLDLKAKATVLNRYLMRLYFPF